MNEPVSYSIVIPFFNEGENVGPLFAELLPVLLGMGRPVEVVAVEDGSSDETRVELERVAREHPVVRVLLMDRNRGQTAAFEAGFRAARGDLIVTMDGDLQIDPEDIPTMIGMLERDQVDFVYGWRQARRDGLSKRVSTKIANKVRNWLTGEDIPDTGCPLKVFRREVVQRMKLFNGMHRFFITLAHMDGWKSAQMVVRHRHRLHGKSKYGVLNRVFRAWRDCFAVRWMMKRHLRYAVSELPSADRSRSRPEVR